MFVSSIAVYGLSHCVEAITEDTPALPRTPYGQSKLEAEQGLHALRSATGLKLTIVRPPLVYGPGNPGNMERLMGLIRSGLPLPLASLRNRRSFLYVGNLVDALLRCAASPWKPILCKCASRSKMRRMYSIAPAAHRTVRNCAIAAQIILDEAGIDLEDAQKDYDDALTTDGATDVLEARADAIIAQEIYDNAMDNLRALQTGLDSPQVQAAAKVVEQVQAVEQAKTSVVSAQSKLNTIETQLKKITVYSPMDGVILTRNVEAGEFVQPGAVTFALANLNELTITVYVPETRLNEIKLGQSVSVTIDDATGESPVFDAEIIHIADQAEFTPRNVQTVEGRSSTVYAVKLKVTNTEGKLKIGMPADVVFE